MDDILTVSSAISIPQSKEEENNCSTKTSDSGAKVAWSGLEGSVKTKVINLVLLI